MQCFLYAKNALKHVCINSFSHLNNTCNIGTLFIVYRGRNEGMEQKGNLSKMNEWQNLNPDTQESKLITITMSHLYYQIQLMFRVSVIFHMYSNNILH